MDGALHTRFSFLKILYCGAKHVLSLKEVGFLDAQIQASFDKLPKITVFEIDAELGVILN